MSAAKKSAVVSQLRRAQMIELLAKGKRLDGRGFLDYRDIKIETKFVGKAEGSARVSIGNTQVVAGVKVEVLSPFPDTPDKGVLMVNAEVLPLASPHAEPGPPDEEAVEIARVVDRGVRETQMIDLSKLVLVAGSKVYSVYADVSMINVDGNLFDTASYSVISSLCTANAFKYVIEDGKAIKQTETFKLPIQTIPISVTMARIGDNLVVDPTSEEEAVMDARITLTTDSLGRICAGQKGRAGSFNFDQIKQAAEIAVKKGEEIRKIVTGATGFVI